MKYLNVSEKAAIRENLDALPGPVRLVLIKDSDNCEACGRLESECRDIEMISSRFLLEKHDRLSNDAEALRYDAPLSPELIVEGVAGGRIRFLGTPSGFEFADFLHSVREAAEGHIALYPATRHKLSNFSKTARIRIFIPATTAFCPPVVSTAQKMAFGFPQISVEIVKLADFPELAKKVGRDAATHVHVNGRDVRWEGVSEEAFADAVVEAALAKPLKDCVD